MLGKNLSFVVLNLEKKNQKTKQRSRKAEKNYRKSGTEGTFAEGGDGF